MGKKIKYNELELAYMKELFKSHHSAAEAVDLLPFYITASRLQGYWRYFIISKIEKYNKLNLIPDESRNKMK